MRAIDRFERFSQPTHNAQDWLKNHIFDRYPVIHTEEEIGDWQSSTDYVWLVDPDIQIYDSFPWYYKPRENDEVAIHAFPYVFKESRKVKSWEKVRLVPTTPGSYKTLEHAHICGHYDPYKGKEKFDIFFIGNDKTVHDNLIDRGFGVQVVDSIQQAQDQSFSDMFWVVYDDTIIRNTFKFSYKPDEWSYDIPHLFCNGDMDRLDGIVLM